MDALTKKKQTNKQRRQWGYTYIVVSGHLNEEQLNYAVLIILQRRCVKQRIYINRVRVSPHLSEAAMRQCFVLRYNQGAIYKDGLLSIVEVNWERTSTT